MTYDLFLVMNQGSMLCLHCKIFNIGACYLELPSFKYFFAKFPKLCRLSTSLQLNLLVCFITLFMLCEWCMKMSRNMSLADSDSYYDVHDDEQQYNGLVTNGSGSQAAPKRERSRNSRSETKKTKSLTKSSPKGAASTEEELKLKELERERKLLEKENAERKRKLDKLKEEEKATLEAAEKGILIILLVF